MSKSHAKRTAKTAKETRRPKPTKPEPQPGIQPMQPTQDAPAKTTTWSPASISSANDRLQRTVGNRAIGRFIRHSDSDQPGRTLQRLISASPVAGGPMIQRRLYTKDELTRLAGGKTVHFGKSAYDKIVDAVAAYPKRTVQENIQLLTQLKADIKDWLTRNKDRNQSRDDDKRLYLPMLERRVDLELQTINPAAPAVAPHILNALRTDAYTVQYLRHHIGDYAAVNQAYGQVFPGKMLRNVMLKHLEGEFTSRGNGEPVYRALRNEFPDPAVWTLIDEAYKKAFDTAQFNRVVMLHRRGEGLSPQLIALATAHSGDLPNLTNAIMAFLRLRRAQADQIENDYNAVIPGVKAETNIVVPDTIGEIVYDYFVSYFQAHGNAANHYQQLMQDYPSFAYRVKPAYRFVFGDAQLRTMLQSIQQAEMAALVPNPLDPANVNAKAAFRTHGPYAVTNFLPSTGSGAGFDATYDPTTGALEITVKVFYDFKDVQVESWETQLPTAGKQVGPQFGQTTWTDPLKTQWKQDFVANTAGLWNANPPTIRCIRPGWNDVIATPHYNIVEVPAKGTQHQIIEATKGVLIEDRGQEKLKSPTTSGAGQSGAGEAAVFLKEWDVKDKINDPAVHHYLHQTEKTTNIEPAYKMDRKRQQRILEQFGRIAFQAGSGTVMADPTRLPILIEEIQRLDIPSLLSHLHPIVIEGNVAAGGFAGLADRRARVVNQAMQAAGIQNPLRHTIGGENSNDVVVKPDAEDPAVLDTYVNNWSRFTAAHEFGHVIGLIDEYYSAASNETVKKMISEGLLPPNTRGDHLTSQASESAGQTATQMLLEQSGLETPDFAVDTAGLQSGQPKSTSIMTGGYEVTKQHYITAWEVLAHMTDDMTHLLEKKFWKIS